MSNNFPSLIKNAESVLSREADGSQANAQQRIAARAVLLNQIESLRLFIARAPESNPSKSMQAEVNRLEAIIGGQNVSH